MFKTKTAREIVNRARDWYRKSSPLDCTGTQYIGPETGIEIVHLLIAPVLISTNFERGACIGTYVCQLYLDQSEIALTAGRAQERAVCDLKSTLSLAL